MRRGRIRSSPHIHEYLTIRSSKVEVRLIITTASSGSRRCSISSVSTHCRMNYAASEWCFSPAARSNEFSGIDCCVQLNHRAALVRRSAARCGRSGRSIRRQRLEKRTSERVPTSGSEVQVEGSCTFPCLRSRSFVGPVGTRWSLSIAQRWPANFSFWPLPQGNLW